MARKKKRIVRIDSWEFPADEAMAFIAERERVRQRLEEAMLTYCARVEYGGQGSEDGEYITGIDAHGEYVVLMHLDPHEVAKINMIQTQEELIELLQSQ